MQTIFKGKRISGILGVLPEQSYDFDEEIKNFQDGRVRRLKKIMGYGSRRRTKRDTQTSDLCICGLRYLLENKWVSKEEIGAIVVLTLTPDYFMPHVSNQIHGELELSQDCVCLDIPQACSSFLTGLMEASMLLEHIPDKKVLVFTANVLSRKEKEDEVFSEAPFGGDAATITIIENSDDAEDIYFATKTDGKRRDYLKMSQQAFCKTENDSHGETQVRMDGSAVFTFVQHEIPPMVQEVLQMAGKTKEDIDWYLFHQPNRFMLEKLADKLEVPREKMFMNIVEKYGNSAGSVLGINIVENLGEELEKKEFECLLSSFGGGLTWNAAVMRLGKMDFCRLIESDL